MPEAFRSGQLIYLGGVSPLFAEMLRHRREYPRTGAVRLSAERIPLDGVVSVLVFLRAASDFGAMMTLIARSGAAIFLRDDGCRRSLESRRAGRDVYRGRRSRSRSQRGSSG